MSWMVLVCLIAVGLWLLDRAGLAAERRGWIYWRKAKRGRGGYAGAVLGGFDEALRPDHVRHVREFRQEVRESSNAGPGAAASAGTYDAPSIARAVRPRD